MGLVCHRVAGLVTGWPRRPRLGKPLPQVAEDSQVTRSISGSSGTGAGLLDTTGRAHVAARLRTVRRGLEAPHRAQGSAEGHRSPRGPTQYRRTLCVCEARGRGCAEAAFAG